MSYSEYIAVGDSVSIDLYPALDLGETDVAVALERVVQAGAIAPVGAASLFHTNDVDRWPDFSGDDLASRYPGITMTNRCIVGATIGLLVSLCDGPGPGTLMSRFLALISVVTALLPVFGLPFNIAAFWTNRHYPGFHRTVSRIREMQSREYMEAERRAAADSLS